MSKSERLTRREFLQLSGAVGALAGTARIGLIPAREPTVHEQSDISEILVVNERVSEILSYYTPLSFDEQGNLLFETQDEYQRTITLSTSLLPTEFSKHVKEKVESVELLVVHYDAGLRYLLDGTERNARNTVKGLNGNDPDGDGRGASVQWCVDGFPISRNENREGGYGILQTQYASGAADKPYRGKHVYIGIDLASGEKDINILETVELFKNLGIKSNLENLVKQGRYLQSGLNKYSVGFEQIGIYFDPGFPDTDQPTRRQVANALSLTTACMRQFSLTPWDIVGHHEIQQKSDPGYYYMGTFRFLIGVAALKGLVPQDLVFDDIDGKYRELRYFEKVAETVRAINRYGRYGLWEDYIGYKKFIDSLNDWYEIRRGNR